MRGIVYKNRKKRLLLIALALAVLCFFSFPHPHWVKQFAEDKVMEFMGYRTTVKIGKVTGGIFRNMILQDVVFSSKRKGEGKVFCLERMEISYYLWRAVMEKFGFIFKGEYSLDSVDVYFSEENSFVRGFVKLYRYPDRVEIMGQVSPVLLGDDGKRSIKGVFLKLSDGRYDCDLLWDGRLKGTGMLDLAGRAIDLKVTPLLQKKGIMKISGSIDNKGRAQCYLRMDKVNVAGAEIIGNIWISYRDPEMPQFSVSAESLVVNKRPFWDFTAEGRFSPQEKMVFFDKVKWGRGVALTGNASTAAPYPVELKLIFKSVELEEMMEMLGGTNVVLTGMADMEVDLTGPVKTAAVKGRLFISEGVLQIAEFRSIFATLGGRLPVVKITDSRMVKDGGHIIVKGEIDFSRMEEGKAFDNMVFDTDNKVAAYDNWQITKEKRPHMVSARKDKVTLSTSLEEDGLQRKTSAEDLPRKELEFRYDLDASNSLKLNFEEEKDFWGVEHKIEF